MRKISSSVAPAEALRARVKRLVFKSADLSYGVALGELSGGKSCTLCGDVCDAVRGQERTFWGNWTTHPKYGRQFKVLCSEASRPQTDAEVHSYLTSGAVKGISPAIGEAIWERFGKSAIDVISNEPERLREVLGIGPKRLMRIKDGWAKTSGMRSVMLFLMQYDITPNLATKIVRTYGAKAAEQLKANPYQLADDVIGVGFLKADAIALSMGIEPNDYFRLSATVKYCLKDMEDDGHCCAGEDDIRKALGKVLNDADQHDWEAVLNRMVSERILSVDRGCYYLPSLLAAEREVTARLAGIAKEPAGKVNVEATLTRLVQLAEARGFEYDVKQLEAVQLALSSKIMIVTGGPGTGKTTTVNGIIQGFELAQRTVVLAAPTGRAAKRLSEATGHEAMTLHRLLGLKPGSSDDELEEGRLEGDVLVLDECSMIDIRLMASVLKAMPAGMRLVLCGDKDQLPSIGPGHVFHDLIESGVLPVARLTKIFRQAQESRIVMAAHQIHDGIIPDIQNDRDLYFLQMKPVGDTPEQIAQKERQRMADAIVNYASERIPNFFGIAADDVQVLCPMRKMEIGCNALNLKLQEAINPCGEPRQEFRNGDVIFRQRDRVMQCRNDYQKDVFNGDIGKVVGFIDATDEDDARMIVNFDGREVAYEADEAGDLQLAYATTIHKSQGSEYPAVIVPVSTSNAVMLQRNLIYTAITRAKKLLLLVGTPKALAMAVKHNPSVNRRSFLAARLKEALA